MRKLTLYDDYRFIVDNFEDMTKESFCDLTFDFFNRMRKEEFSYEKAKNILGKMIIEICFYEEIKKTD